MFFLRLIKGTFIRQWKKMSMIAFTIALGTSIAAAMVNVMLDVSDKINEELKAYGANITVVSKEAAVLSDLYELEDDSLTRNMYLKEETTGELLTIFWANNIRDFNPVLDGYVSLDGHKTTLVGSWFNHHLAYAKKGSTYERDTGIINLRSWWTIQNGSWINEQGLDDLNVCMIGTSIAETYGYEVGQNITVSDKTSKTLKIVGIYDSGDDEDDYIYTPLSISQQLFNKEGYVKSIAVSAITSPDDDLSRKAAKDPTSLKASDYDLWYCTAYASSICYQIQEAVPEASASVIRQVSDSEGNILNKTQLLMTLITILSLFGATLGISNLVTSVVSERRSEFGLLKAIGAKSSQVIALILVELLIMAVIGEVAGYFLGFGFAQIIGQTVFSSSITMYGIVAALVFIVVTFVTLLGSIPAIRLLLKIRPSEALRDR